MLLELKNISHCEFACLTSKHNWNQWQRADSRFVPSQWAMSLQSNAVSQWLGAYLESALNDIFHQSDLQQCISVSFYLICGNFHSIKCLWSCGLLSISHFVSASLRHALKYDVMTQCQNKIIMYLNRYSTASRLQWFKFQSLHWSSKAFYPSALRAGGVLSSRSGRAAGRAAGRAGGCQTCGTHISVTA